MIESIARILHHRHNPINTMKIHYIQDNGRPFSSCMNI